MTYPMMIIQFFKKLKMKIRPATVFIIYMIVLLFCAALYFLVPSMLSQKADVITALYFSVITIATVGYGDITPASDFGKIIAGSEALLGIILIGLFLNSLWQSYTERIASGREEVLLKQQKSINTDRIKVYYFYLSTVISNFKVSLAEMTTPINDRKEKQYCI